jgi:hypothetical protein
VWWFNENNTISRLKKDGTLKGVISQEAGKDIINKLQGEANAHAEHDAGAK